MLLNREETKVVEEVDVLTATDEPLSLVVFNDDFNTFDHVINTLIKVCKHTKEQAEQCTYIIHFVGKCSVKEGSIEHLEPMLNGINAAGISASII